MFKYLIPISILLAGVLVMFLVNPKEHFTPNKWEIVGIVFGGGILLFLLREVVFPIMH